MSGNAFGKVTALMASVMDVHVRLALQEMSREKRRLIGGGVFLAMGLTFLTLATVALQLVLLLWLRERFDLGWGKAAAAVAGIDLLLSGLCLRLGGQLLKGPYLPETTAGLMRGRRVVFSSSSRLSSCSSSGLRFSAMWLACSVVTCSRSVSCWRTPAAVVPL